MRVLCLWDVMILRRRRTLLPTVWFAALVVMTMAFGWGGSVARVATPTPVRWKEVSHYGTCSNGSVLNTSTNPGCVASLPVGSGPTSLTIQKPSGIHYLVVEMSRDNHTTLSHDYTGRIHMVAVNASNPSQVIAEDTWAPFSGVPYALVVVNVSSLGNAGTFLVNISASYGNSITTSQDFVNMSGPLRLREASHLNDTCPYGPFGTTACGGNGTCAVINDGSIAECKCTQNITGEYCSVSAPPITLNQSVP